MSYLNYDIPPQVSNHNFSCTNDFNDYNRTYLSNGLKILQINAKSIASTKKFDCFKNFIFVFNCDIDVIIVGESWISHDFVGLYNIVGYSVYHSCRSGVGGGVCMYVRVTR